MRHAWRNQGDADGRRPRALAPARFSPDDHPALALSLRSPRPRPPSLRQSQPSISRLRPFQKNVDRDPQRSPVPAQRAVRCRLRRSPLSARRPLGPPPGLHSPRPSGCQSLNLSRPFVPSPAAPDPPLWTRLIHPPLLPIVLSFPPPSRARRSLGSAPDPRPPPPSFSPLLPALLLFARRRPCPSRRPRPRRRRRSTTPSQAVIQQRGMLARFPPTLLLSWVSLRRSRPRRPSTSPASSPRSPSSRRLSALAASHSRRSSSNSSRRSRRRYTSIPPSRRR